MRTNTTEFESTISHPGSVKINVKGAFIIDQDSASPSGGVNGVSHDTKDIRLPNHKAVVSHIAVDVCFLTSVFAIDVRLLLWNLWDSSCLEWQIGWSLAKLVYFSREPLSREPGGRPNFLNFETDRIG
jgi:type II pantothenate kinase